MVVGDVAVYLTRATEAFDLVFVDPPYELSLALVNEVLESVTARLANGGLMVLHRRAGEASPDAPLGTHQIDDRRYGGTQLWILEKDES